jgi:hypothetical protein
MGHKLDSNASWVLLSTPSLVILFRGSEVWFLSVKKLTRERKKQHVHLEKSPKVTHPDLSFAFVMLVSKDLMRHYKLCSKGFFLCLNGDFCQTPTPCETWELTLISRCNKNKNDPHLNCPKSDCARVLKFCMRPSVTFFEISPFEKN